MPAGLSLPEREALRQRYLDKAVAQAARMGVTGRCRRVLGDLAHPDHGICRGECPGGVGCLCKCHDHAESVTVTDSESLPYGGRA